MNLSTRLCMFIVQSSFFALQVTSVFEGLHEGRILCSAAADNNILLTGGESTVRMYTENIT